jgi:hypothetical protein
MHFVPELPDVARPGIGFHLAKHLLAEARESRADLSPSFLDKEGNEISNVTRPLPQGRKNQTKAGKPEVKIPSEPFESNAVFEVGMCCGKDSNLNTMSVIRTERAHLTGVEKPKKPSLRLFPHLSDLIEEERSTFC